MPADAFGSVRAEAKERGRYLDKLSPEQDAAVRDLTAAEHALLRHPVQYTQLAHAARQKRIIDHISPTYRLAAMVVFGLAAAAALFGVYSIVQGMGGAVYFVLFGIAAIFAVVSSRILPTGRNNREAAQEDWESALQAMAKIVDEESAGRQTFPVPAQYAHPVVLERMIRVVREGRASSAAERGGTEFETEFNGRESRTGERILTCPAGSCFIGLGCQKIVCFDYYMLFVP
ncbi:hypothetical protein ACTQ56_13040 [[Clostridium] aminophilum]|uniref:hypothetical protein n=1 Tax=[Clostridium] aminophilum TaxID=1526 RepID=UPI003F96075B